MRVGSLFTGIGGFDLGFHRVGFTLAWMVECDPFCQTVLRHRFPGVPLHDDVCTVTAATVPPVDVLVGGFPCQDLSVAGQRKGLHGERSRLFFEFVRLLRALRPRWMVLENVPGFLSARRGHDFAHTLDQLDACGYVGSWRVLDSQYFGLAQRRQRVFLVARPRECGNGAQTVLFEPESRERHSAAGDEAGADVAACLRGRAHGAGVNEPGRGGEDDVNLVACALTANYGKQVDSSDDGSDNLIADTLLSPNGGPRTTDLSGNFQSTAQGVRRLTPLECERLQGFPDGWSCLCGEGHRGTQYCTCPDTPRYKALGNAVSVPVAEWIARRMLAQTAAEAHERAVRQECVV
jgi:DNA (cytosine-5)-methyltransferase 1